MKKLIYILSLFTAALMAACEKHVEPVDLTLKVGNVYRIDGTIVPVDYHRGQGTDAPQAVGIITAVGTPEDNYSALVMALRDLDGTYWFTAKKAETEVSSDIQAFNGKENTAMLLSEYAEDKELDPMGAVMASTYSVGGISGWHLPSVGEMRSVADNRFVIRRTLQLLGPDVADDFTGDWYLTSTVDGSSGETSELYNYCIIMPEGRFWSELKTHQHKVRPFLMLR